MGILDIALTPFKSASNAVQNLTGEKAAKGEAARNRQFQERLSSTAYQRAATDLEAAGLNRILAIGSPASTPAGAQAPIPNTLDSMIGGAKMASDLSTQKSQRGLMKDQALQARSTAKAASSRADLDTANARIKKEIADLVETPEGFQSMLKEGKDNLMKGINSAKDYDKQLQQYIQDFGNKVDDKLEDFLDNLNILPDVFGGER